VQEARVKDRDQDTHVAVCDGQPRKRARNLSGTRVAVERIKGAGGDVAGARVTKPEWRKWILGATAATSGTVLTFVASSTSCACAAIVPCGDNGTCLNQGDDASNDSTAAEDQYSLLDGSLFDVRVSDATVDADSAPASDGGPDATKDASIDVVADAPDGG
jgi:hypothetical protein